MNLNVYLEDSLSKKLELLAEKSQKTPICAYDVLKYSTVKTHKMILVTLNVRESKRVVARELKRLIFINIQRSIFNNREHHN